MANWEHYFHFLPDSEFYIDGPWGYNGQGRVLERSDTRLVIRMDLDAWGPAPALHATVTVEYRQEGPGNIVVLERDGADPRRDEDATIVSTDSRRERAISSKDITCSIRYENTDQIDFDILVNGKSYDFDFER